jgi:ribosomal protein S17
MRELLEELELEELEKPSISIEKAAERYVEVLRLLKQLEAEKEELRKRLVYSEKEKIKTRNGTVVRITTRKTAIVDNDKVIFTLNKKELTEVATISISKLRKLAENRFNVDDFVEYRETKEIKVIPPKEEEIL